MLGLWPMVLVGQYLRMFKVTVSGCLLQGFLGLQTSYWLDTET